jgi:hypothetical protein
MALVKVSVSVEKVGRFTSAIAEGRAAGLNVSQMFQDLGVASGTIEAGSLPALKAIPGLCVEEDRVPGIPGNPPLPSNG